MIRHMMPIFMVFLLFAGCGGKKQETTADEPQYTIFVTIQPLRSLAEAIAGNRAEVRTFLLPEIDPRTYVPVPEDSARLSHSGILFQVGLGLDEWAAVPALRAEDGPRIVPVSVGVPVLPLLPERLWKKFLDSDKVPKHGNAFVWLDPAITADLILPAMLKAIIAADPKKELAYRANFSKMQEEVKTFSEDTRAKIAYLKGSAVILHNGSFLYFCRQYGIHVIDIIEPFPGYVASDEDLTEIFEFAKDKKPVAVLVETFANTESARKIADQLEIPIIVIDPFGNENEGYIDLMKRNIKAISKIEVKK